MYIAVGKLTKPHGTKGHIKALSYAGVPERFEQVKTIFVETESGIERFLVETFLLQGQTALLKLKTIDSRADAQLLSSCELLLPESQKIDLPENAFFVHELVGLSVFDHNGCPLGDVQEVMQNAGNDIYVVKNGTKEILIPAVSQFVKKIDLTNKRMDVALIEGMLDDEN